MAVFFLGKYNIKPRFTECMNIVLNIMLALNIMSTTHVLTILTHTTTTTHTNTHHHQHTHKHTLTDVSQMSAQFQEHKRMLWSENFRQSKYPCIDEWCGVR